MEVQPHDRQDELLNTDHEYRELEVKHHELDHRLHELSAKPYPSPPEQLEEITLKKQKLQLKDRMEDIRRRQRMEPA